MAFHIWSFFQTGIWKACIENKDYSYDIPVAIQVESKAKLPSGGNDESMEKPITVTTKILNPSPDFNIQGIIVIRSKSVTPVE